jgi:hypothetical protein
VCVFVRVERSIIVLIYKNIVLGHRSFGLGTGQVIPVLVKIDKVIGIPPKVTPAPWEKIDTCSAPPKV